MSTDPSLPAEKDDPPPVAPLPPDDAACCGSGCDPCIWDWYQQERDRYQAELKAWQARHPPPAEQMRRACIEAALEAWEDTGVRGLCAEGRFEAAVDAMRRLPLPSPVAKNTA